MTEQTDVVREETLDPQGGAYKSRFLSSIAYRFPQCASHEVHTSQRRRLKCQSISLNLIILAKD